MRFLSLLLFLVALFFGHSALSCTSPLKSFLQRARPRIQEEVFRKNSLEVSQTQRWDNRIYRDKEGYLLQYVLSAHQSHSRQSSALRKPTPRDLNAYIRELRSYDNGKTWVDKGAVLLPSPVRTAFDSQAIWTMDRLQARNGDEFLFYTGLGQAPNFHQNLGLAHRAKGEKYFKALERPLFNPFEHRLKAEDLGYHLDEGDEVIKAWRDPFYYRGRLLFAAKAVNQTGRIHPTVGQLKMRQAHFLSWDLAEPLDLRWPRGLYVDQVEVPSLIEKDGELFLFVTTNRSVRRPDDPQNACRVFKARDMSAPFFPVNQARDISNAEKTGLYAVSVSWDPLCRCHRYSAFRHLPDGGTQPVHGLLKWNGDTPQLGPFHAVTPEGRH